MFADAIAFHASSININFLIPFNLRILEINTSMMIIVVIGNRILWCRLSTQRLVAFLR